MFLWPRGPPLVVASDGRQDEKAPPSIAVLVADPGTGERWGVCATIPAELEATWQCSEHSMALVEQVAVMLGLLELPGPLREMEVIWFEDNSSVLSGLVRGGSSHEVLDAGFASIHMLLAALGTRCWFEWVKSKANWSDEASR